MTDAISPTYRFRGSVRPSAEVSRPVTVRMNATASKGDKSTSATLDILDVVDSYGGFWGISARDVDAALGQVGDVDTLYVRINSPGGEATEGVAIANLLRAHKASVHVSVIGLAASAASYIATAGDVVTMAPGSMLMAHDAWLLTIGNADELRKDADSLDALSDSIASLYALKAGGTVADWRAVMKETVWYTAAAAVKAGLADAVGIDPAPSPVPAEDPATDPDADDTDALAKAAARFDLSMFAHLPAAAMAGPHAPAIEPVAPSTEPKEADAMSDTLLDGLRKQLGLEADADEATVLAANAEALTEKADPPKVDPPKAEIPAGMVVVDAQQWDDVKAMAAKGAQASARQSAEDRDVTIAKAISDGKLSRNEDNVTKLKADWDADPELTAKRIADMAVLYPVASVATGYSGGENQTSSDDAFYASVFSDEKASV